MQAVRCPKCGLLVGIGAYGPLKIAAANVHYPRASEYPGYADLAECWIDREVCPGSEMLGQVEEV
jgi:hypothetical protein